MPEFQLNLPETKRALYDSLDDFAKGYVEAMFFTNCDSGEERENLANELGVDKLTNRSILSIKKDCNQFKFRAHLLLIEAYDRDGYDEAQAGRDFWFTRQRHGVGYWDRSQLDADELGDQLSKVARKFGEAMTSIYRGWIHHS